jgi:hypothetical protein
MCIKGENFRLKEINLHFPITTNDQQHTLVITRRIFIIKLAEQTTR